MNNKLCKILMLPIIIFIFISITAISASALSWDGSSTGGGGAGYAAGPNGYAIRTTGDNCLGYRFSVVDKYGNNKVSKVIDVFRNTTYGNLEYGSAYKFTTKYNKKQLINYQNNGFSTSQNTTNCYKEVNMGFASSLPVASGIGTWQNNTTNLNAVLSALGAGNIGSLVNGDKIIVEPLYDIRLQSIYHSITVTETALYGKWILGANSNGGYSSTSQTWGFIAAYTNRYYPNELYTPDGQGLWTGATAIGSTSKETFYNIINKGYGVGIAYTETKPDFSPTLSVNVCEAWKGYTSNRSYHFGTTNSNTFDNFSSTNGYPVLGDSVWFALNFPSESQAVRVRQYVRHGGNWITRDVNLNGGDTSSMWFDVIFTGNEGGGSQPTNNAETSRVFYWIEAKQDWIDGSGNVLKSGAVKSFYIPIKPKINRYQVSMIDIQGNQVAKANANSTNQVGSVYVGQRVYPKYNYTSENTWTSYNYLRGAIYQWINGAWNTTYPYNGGTDLYIDNQAINNTSPYERYSDIGLYRVPDNSANTNGSNRIPFKLWTHWVPNWQKTTEETWIDIPIVKADAELKEILLIDENGYYISPSSTIWAYSKVTPQYVYRNNTDVAIFVEGYNNDGSKIDGTYKIPPYDEIYVNGKQMTVGSSTFNVWGGVYLEGATKGSTGWEKDDFDSQWNNHWSRYWNVQHPLKIQTITPNSNYRENTEVMTSFKVQNFASINYIPTNNISVRFSAYNGSTLLYSTTKSSVVIPANGDNLVSFKWTVGAGLNGANITLKGEVLENGVVVDTKTLIHPSEKKPTSQTPDTVFEKSAPAGFSVLSPPTRTNYNQAQWSEWIYENNAFVKKTYGLNLNTASKPVLIPDVNSPSRVLINGIWYMKSGYGFTANWNIGIGVLSGTLAPTTTVYTDSQLAMLYFPEFKYLQTAGNFRVLDRTATNTFQLPINPNGKNARLHFIPIWFPNTSYITQGYVSDIWTPAGMMSSYMNSAPVIITQSMYDDRYIGR